METQGKLLSGYRKRSLQNPYLPLLAVSARVAPLNPLGPLPISGLWHTLEIAPHPQPISLFFPLLYV